MRLYAIDVESVCATNPPFMILLKLSGFIHLGLALSFIPLNINHPVELPDRDPPTPGTYSPFLTRCPTTNLIRKADKV